MSIVTTRARWGAPAAGLVILVAGCASATSTPKSTSTAKSTAPITLTLAIDGEVGAKNGAEANWLADYAIPHFEQQEADLGRTVTVNLEGSPLDDADFATKIALELKAGSGPDLFDIDGPYVGEYASSGYIKPLNDIVGASTVNAWSGWSQITPAVQENMEFNGQRYGIPGGPDGRVLYFNKSVLTAAGLPANWQPTSWQDIISAAQKIKAAEPGVIPLQIDAGANPDFGEATTLQGFLPLLAGQGQLIYNTKTKKWQGDTPAVVKTLDFFKTIYSTGLANSALQVNPAGREASFQQFSQEKIGILLESEWLYDSVISPVPNTDALYPMPARDAEVGYTLIPAATPGSGIRGQSFVSMSGGGGRTINPNTKQPQMAWALLTYLSSSAAVTKYETDYVPGITALNNVNETLTVPEDQFIAKKVLPLTAFRPSLAVYPQVSADIQTMVQSVAEGQATPQQAAQTFSQAITAIPGIGANHVTNS